VKRAFSSGFATGIATHSPAACLAVLLFAGLALSAQPPVGRATGAIPAAAKLEVPENLAEHPAPAQPLPFSHKTHGMRGLQCRQCHTNPEPGSQMTFPAVAICMGCHNNIAKERPAITKLAEFAKSGQPIPWARVFQVTPGVSWNHRKHLQAGFECANCHGQVGQLDQMSQTTAVTSMASCISCHQAHKANTVCETCHAWPAIDNARASKQP
jgi:hypothetical protein